MSTVPDDVYEKFIGWCDKLALQQSQLGGMAIQAGLDSIVRAVSPVDSISPEKLAQIAAAYEQLGLIARSDPASGVKELYKQIGAGKRSDPASGVKELYKQIGAGQHSKSKPAAKSVSKTASKKVGRKHA